VYFGSFLVGLSPHNPLLVTLAALACDKGAWWNSHQGQGFVGCSFLSDDQQSYVRNDIEYQKDDFEQPDERVKDHVEGFSGNGKPFALRTVHQIRGYYKQCGRKEKKNSVYDCTPHKECC
jgi:hypothetical protein